MLVSSWSSIQEDAINTEKAREFYQEYLDTIYHRRRAEEIGRFVSNDLVIHPPFPGELNLSGLKTAAQTLLEAFSDLRVLPDLFMYTGDMIATRITFTGVHTGPFVGIPATGRKVQCIAHAYYLLRDGKIVELWDCTDTLTLMQQLGVIPPVGGA
jgi:predicted ester cyclase